MSNPLNESGSDRLHHFTHEAMATIYEIFIAGEEKEYAEQAASEAFAELDRLEDELSRYRPNSDISRINAIGAGDEIVLGPDAYACLAECRKFYDLTGGAFDITAGRLYDIWLDENKKLRQPSEQEIAEARAVTGMDLLVMQPGEFSVQVQAGPLRVDLGGYGKGYALDLLKELFDEWSIADVIIHGGASSVLAMGAPEGKSGWELTISNPVNRAQTLLTFALTGAALGSSGIQKGRHIIDPRKAEPAEVHDAVWVAAPDAAAADALSTAFMILNKEEIETCAAALPGVGALVLPSAEINLTPDDFFTAGDWPFAV